MGFESSHITPKEDACGIWRGRGNITGEKRLEALPGVRVLAAQEQRPELVSLPELVCARDAACPVLSLPQEGSGGLSHLLVSAGPLKGQGGNQAWDRG